ncbi:FadR family transcriptional regulator [Bradyrhizobium sp. 197]|uniref:FadR/GntR family transcriptional regulator n=1 Tax=Bradyrhizobium sp. 197 TaxID=2782663 RepID=UPI001FF79C37|nr:FadR/GntR family transcriptional regulator [Bradyrhizobium sp. 197]MCK1479488.1 FadR family transcriptional regulator [Bradyrhizobium sp. 197]
MALPPSSSSLRLPRGGSQLLGAKATRAPRLAEQLYTQIYKLITAGHFAVNSKLPSEAELCEAFGVSRPVVREAMSRLHADGVVETQRGAGSFVRLRHDAELFKLAPIGGLPDLLRCMELRSAIEGDAAFLAASRRTEEDLGEMRGALDELAQAIETRQIGHAADLRFHQAVAVACRNDLFTNCLQALSTQIFDFMRVMRSLALSSTHARLRMVQDEHVQIYRAILEEDPDRARQAMRQHIANSKSRTLADTVAT